MHIVSASAGIAVFGCSEGDAGMQLLPCATYLPTIQCVSSDAIFVTLRILFRYRPWKYYRMRLESGAPSANAATTNERAAGSGLAMILYLPEKDLR